MLAEQPLPEYKCDECGNSWKARKADASQRRCPACGSRSASPVIEEKAMEKVAETAQGGGVPALDNDPDIIKAMKEVRLAELRARIAEITGKIESPLCSKLGALQDKIDILD